MANKLVVAAMLIIAVLNLVAYFETGSTFSLMIAIGLLALSAWFSFKLRR